MTIDEIRSISTAANDKRQYILSQNSVSAYQSERISWIKIAEAANEMIMQAATKGKFYANIMVRDFEEYNKLSAFFKGKGYDCYMSGDGISADLVCVIHWKPLTF